MLTPVVLISATASLLLSTSNRLNRAVDRARNLSAMIEHLVQEDTTGALFEERRRLIYSQLYPSIRRARLLHQTMSALYLTLAVFVAASAALGYVSIRQSPHTEIAILLGIAGVVLLFYASVLLIVETRIARGAIDAELNYTLRVGEQYASPELKEMLQARASILSRLRRRRMKDNDA
jgi:hypothetical protein